MTQFTPELIAKAKTAKSADELLSLAAENGVNLTPDEAKIYFEQFNTNKELADDELDFVVGGSKKCGEEQLTVGALPVGTHVEVVNGNCCPKCSSTLGYSRRILKTGEINMLLLEVEIVCGACEEVILGEVYESDIVRV